MEKSKVIEFFDRCAPTWDAEMIRSDERINKILDFAGVKEGVRVLDVACGTGVLIPDYLGRNVAKIVGVDISPGMIEIAREKFNTPMVDFICADVEETNISGFDVCVVYNAFPHFENPRRLIENLSKKLKLGGRLTVAHGMSRRQINEHHKGVAAGVSNTLMESEALKEIFAPYFNVDVCVSDGEIYVVSGIKSKGETLITEELPYV